MLRLTYFKLIKSCIHVAIHVAICVTEPVELGHVSTNYLSLSYNFANNFSYECGIIFL